MKFATISLSGLLAAFVAADPPVPPHPACTTQDAGHCNFGIEGLANGGDAKYTTWFFASVYDHNCKIIGGWDVSPGHFPDYPEWHSMSSQLPYKVVWSQTGNTPVGDQWGNTFGFKYGDQSYNGDFACRVESDHIHVCQHSFKCSGF